VDPKPSAATDPPAGDPRPETLLAGQNRALELIAGGAPLGEILEYLVRFIEAQACDLRCSILLLEGDRLRRGAAPSLPADYSEVVDGLRVGPAVGACGTAAFTGQPVVCEDITTDPRWTWAPDIVRRARAGGLRACWSTPILGPHAAVLGTFAMYYPAPGRPRPGDLHLVAIATHVAGIAIQRHRADRALTARAERLAEADRRKDEFLALLAHELRNPLAPIVTAVEMLRAPGAPTETLARYVPVIERQVHQMRRLIDDLLDVSRITRGQIQLRRERMPLAAALACAVESARPLLTGRGHALTLALPDDPLEVDADPVRLAQVLANLLNNAAKYTPPGGHVNVCAAREGEEIVIEVRDDGLGIAPEMVERIFDLFVQTDAARGDSQGGLGIGLTLVRRLVEMHGGHVEARSAGLGQGSTFTVRLPAARGPTVIATPATPAAHMVARRVLVVDDNADAAECLADALRAEGHDVHVEREGRDALTFVAAAIPDVAIIDIGMPGMDGYELARRLRAEHPGAPLRLVALTGYGQEADVRQARDAGFDAHLVKPADLRRLVAAMSA
jgi:signal transduction histidine kinase